MGILEEIPANVASDEAQAAILEAVRNGRAEGEWCEVVSRHAGHELAFLVGCDALRIDGIRVPVTAYTQQQIADLLGAMLPTPKIVDLIWEQGTRLTPTTHGPPITARETVRSVNERIDRKIAEAGAEGALVANVGKDWTLYKRIRGQQAEGVQMAANYGWLMPSTVWGGIRLGPTVSLPGVYGIQAPPGTRHGFREADYSQVARLVARYGATLNGTPIDDLARILEEPELAPLLSHEGVTITRQPGVPELEALGGPNVKGEAPPIFHSPSRPPASPPVAQPAAIPTVPVVAAAGGGVLLAFGLAIVGVILIRNQ